MVATSTSKKPPRKSESKQPKLNLKGRSESEKDDEDDVDKDKSASDSDSKTVKASKSSGDSKKPPNKGTRKELTRKSENPEQQDKKPGSKSAEKKAVAKPKSVPAPLSIKKKVISDDDDSDSDAKEKEVLEGKVRNVRMASKAATKKISKGAKEEAKKEVSDGSDSEVESIEDDDDAKFGGKKTPQKSNSKQMKSKSKAESSEEDASDDGASEAEEDSDDDDDDDDDSSDNDSASEASSGSNSDNEGAAVTPKSKSKPKSTSKSSTKSKSPSTPKSKPARARKPAVRQSIVSAEMRRSEYSVHRTDWLSRPITKYTASYCLPPSMGTEDTTAKMFDDLWGDERSTISEWITSLPVSEVGVDNGLGRVTVPNAALKVTFNSKDASSSPPVFVRPYEGRMRKISTNTNKKANKKTEIDLYLNAAGPIWCIAYAPENMQSPSNKSRSSSYKPFERYIAVGTSRIGWLDYHTSSNAKTLAGTWEVGDDIPYNLGMKYKSHNLLQIWKLTIGSKSAQNSDENREELDTNVSIHYCIGMPGRGPVWRIAWSSWTPYKSEKNANETENENENNKCNTFEKELYEKSLNFLGLLAVVCGDGSCLVFMLPRSSTTNSSTSTSKSSGSKNDDAPASECQGSAADRCQVIPEHCVCRWEVTLPKGCVGSKHAGSDTTRITTASWNPHNSLQLCCGLEDGTIAVWDLDPKFLNPTSLKRTHEKSFSRSPEKCSHESDTKMENGYDASDSRKKSDLSTSLTSDISELELSTENAVLSVPMKCKVDMISKNKHLYVPPPYLRLLEYNTDFAMAPRSAITSASFCPYNPDLLMSSGYESAIKIWSVHSTTRPLLRRHYYQGWVLDAQWDLLGCGIYGSYSDDSSIYWDSLWSAPLDAKQHRPLYEHGIKHAGVWGVNNFLCNGQSAVASVSSDGSVRCGFSSTMGTSKQGDRRRKGVEKWAMEIFRVENTTESEGSKVSDQMEIDDDALESEEDSWSGTVASIGVSLKRSLDIEYGMIRIATHSLALHSVVSTPLTLQDSRGTVMSHLKNTVLMAYGGASGLLRIHSIDLLEDIVGIGSH